MVRWYLQMPVKMLLSNSATLLCLALVVCTFCTPRPINAKPFPAEESDKIALASQDYLDLLALLGKSLPGTPAEKTKVIDLLLQLLAEIDLPTLCNVISNDTSFSNKETDVMDNDVPVVPTSFQATASQSVFSNAPNEVNEYSGDNEFGNMKVNDYDAVVTEKDEVRAKTEGSKRVSNSTRSNDSPSSEAKSSPHDSLTGRPFKKIVVRPWRQRFANNVNTDGTLPYPLRLRRRKRPVLKSKFIKNARDLKDFGLPVPEKYSVPINLIKRRKIETLRASGKDRNLFIRSIGMRKPKAQLYSQSLVLGEWMDEHAPEKKAAGGNVKNDVEHTKRNEIFAGKSDDSIVKDTKLGRRVMLVVRKGGKKRMPVKRIIYRRPKINSAASSRRGPIQYRVVKRIRSTLAGDSNKAGKKVVKKSFFLPRDPLKLRLHRAKGDRFGAGGHRIIRNSGTKRRIFAGRPRVLRIRAGSRMRGKTLAPIADKNRFIKAVGEQIEEEKLQASEAKDTNNNNGSDHQTDAGVTDESDFAATPKENIKTSPTQTSLDETAFTKVISTSPEILSNDNFENVINGEDISLEEFHQTEESEDPEIDQLQEEDDIENSSKYKTWDGSNEFEQVFEDEENMVDNYGDFESYYSQAPKIDKYSNLVNKINEEQHKKTLYKKSLKTQKPDETLMEREITTMNSLAIQKESMDKDSANQEGQVNVNEEDHEADYHIENVEIGQSSSPFEEEETTETTTLPFDISTVRNEGKSIPPVDDINHNKEINGEEKSDSLSNFEISNITAFLGEREVMETTDALSEGNITTVTFVKENEETTASYDEHETAAGTTIEESEATTGASNIEQNVTASTLEVKERFGKEKDNTTEGKLQTYPDDEITHDGVKFSVGNNDVTEASEIALLSTSSTQRSNKIQNTSESDESSEVGKTETFEASVTKENTLAEVEMAIDPFMVPINKSFGGEMERTEASKSSPKTTSLQADNFVDKGGDNMEQSDIDVQDIANKVDGLLKEQPPSEPKGSQENFESTTETIKDTERNLPKIDSTTDGIIEDVEITATNNDIVSSPENLTQEGGETFDKKVGTLPKDQEVTTKRVFIKPIRINFAKDRAEEARPVNSVASVSRRPSNEKLPPPGDIVTRFPTLTETSTILEVDVDSTIVKSPHRRLTTNEQSSNDFLSTETPSDAPHFLENLEKEAEKSNPAIDVISKPVKRFGMLEVDEQYASLIREPLRNNLTTETLMKVTTFTNYSRNNQTGTGLHMLLNKNNMPNSFESDSSNIKLLSDSTTVGENFEEETTHEVAASSLGQTLKSTTTESDDIELPSSSINDKSPVLEPFTSEQTSSSPVSTITTTTATTSTESKTAMPKSITHTSGDISDGEENDNKASSEIRTTHPVNKENNTHSNEGTLTSTLEYDELTKGFTETDKSEQHLITESSPSSESSHASSEPEITTPVQTGNRERVAWEPEDTSQNVEAQLQKLRGFHYLTKPKVSTFQAKFNDWIGHDGKQEYIEPKSDKIDLWKAYNIALTNNYKSDRKPKLEPEISASSSKRNYLWNARSGFNSFENSNMNSLPKQAYAAADGNKEASYNQVDPHVEKTPSFKPFASLDDYRKEHIKNWGNRFSQGFYGRVYDEPNTINRRFGFTNGDFTGNVQQNFIKLRTDESGVVSRSKDQSQRVNSPQIIVEKPKESLRDFSEEEMRGLWYKNQASVDKTDVHNLFNKNSLKDATLTSKPASKAGQEEGENDLRDENNRQAHPLVNHISQAAALEREDLGPMGVAAPDDFVCPGMFGYHSDPEDCQSFFICSWGVPYRISCPEGTLWNPRESVCDWAAHVPCPHRDRGYLSDSDIQAANY